MQTYTHYKDSGIDWIGQIPAHWDLIKLKHIFREKPKTLNPTLSAGSISFGKVIYKNDEKIPESTKASYQEVLAGDFLINPLNLNYDLISLRIALSTINVVVSSGYIVLQDIIEINKDFYKWFLHQYDVSYMKLLGSGVRQTINFNHIANSLLAFPPIQEQEAIANFLDRKTAKIDALVQTKEQQIEKLKELRQAKIHQAVTKGIPCHAEPVEASSKTHALSKVEMKDSGVPWIGEIPEHWEVKKITHLYNQIGSGTTPTSGLSIYYDKGTINYLQTGDLNDGYIKDVSKKVTQKALIDFSSLKLYPKGSLVVAMYGATIGKLGILNIETTTNQACCVLGKNSDSIQTKFTFYWFLFAKQNIINMSYGGGQPNISQDLVKSLRLQIPPIQEQEQIVTYLDELTGKIDQAIAQKQEQITKLKEYKQSLINDLVTGKIKVC